MMEGGRCGRRKQRNPKRKNVENGIDETDQAALDNNKNEIDELSTRSSSPGSCHSDKEEDSQNDCSDSGDATGDHDNKQSTDSSIDNSSEITSCQEAEPKDENVVKSTAPPSPAKSDSVKGEDENPAIPEPEKPPAGKESTGNHVPDFCRTESEEHQIQEYLSRGDTAVIFPEPVSDGEKEEADLGNNSEEEEIVLKCMHCTETFTRANVLRDHMRENHADKPLKFMCPKCEETFHQKSQLDKHLALHSPTSQICRVCNKTFANVYRLQRHMISHDESTDLRKFKCHECGKAFKFKHHLKEHIRIHSGEKPFECPNCQKRFSHSGSYSSHMTSKKCWVVSAHKNRVRQEGSESFTNFTPKISFSTSKISYPTRSPLQSVPVSHPHQQFLPFSQPRKSNLPTYFPPHMYDAPGFLPCALYPVTTSMGSHLPSIGITALPSFKMEQHASVPAKKPDAPASPDSQSAQISPDVNSNTKLLISKEALPQAPGKESEKGDSEKEKEKTPEAESNIHVKMEVEETADSVDTSKENTMMEETENQTTNGELPCRFCGNIFKSPVDQHQHERYMCKQNKDVVVRMSQIDPARQSPSSSMSECSQLDRRTPNGSVDTATDEEDVEEMFKEGEGHTEDKKLRIRSLFTEDQLSLLKTQYTMNPRPRKFELIRIGNRIGFPKRVVQVWFQNMRARDRKQGRDIPYVVGSNKPESQEREISKSPSYIPNVPKPFPHKVNGLNQVPSNHGPTKKTQEAEFPLDLSVRRTPPLAHGGSCSRLSTPDPNLDDQVLNLSMKKEMGEKRSADSKDKEEERSRCNAQSSFCDSAIFKYMQQEGMFQNQRMSSPLSRRSMSPSVSQVLQNQIVSQSIASVLKMPACSTIPDTDSGPVQNGSDVEASSQKGDKTEDAISGRLVIDEGTELTKEIPALLRGSAPMTSTPLKDFDDDLHEDTHNLATLAEAASVLSGKPKRLRKKTWRQMEAEEVQLDFDDSTSTDDDMPMKKKRKSWKNHRVDRDEGMYACDQCNKMFSKQSSLARHKYEHSGARPFACDMCTKAFKHKHHLTEHKRLHSGEKPFQCKKCGKRFSHSGSFSQHMNHRYNYCSPHKGDDGDADMSS